MVDGKLIGGWARPLGGMRQFMKINTIIRGPITGLGIHECHGHEENEHCSVGTLLVEERHQQKKTQKYPDKRRKIVECKNGKRDDPQQTAHQICAITAKRRMAGQLLSHDRSKNQEKPNRYKKNLTHNPNQN